MMSSIKAGKRKGKYFFNTLPAAAITTGLGLLALLNLNAVAAVSNSDGSAWIDIEKPHAFAEIFLDRDVFSSAISLTVEPQDVGSQGDIFLVAEFNDTWYMKSAGRWQRWDQKISSLQPLRSGVLAAEESIQVLEDNWLQAGNYTVMAAYQPSGGSLVQSAAPLVFSVEASGKETLQSFSSAAAMEAYLKQGLKNGANGQLYTFAQFSPVADTAVTASESASRVSGTNLQVSNVDEQDHVKTDGNVLYALETCGESPCLGVYGLDATAPAADRLASYGLTTERAPDGMFLVQNRSAGNDLLVTIGGQNRWAYWYDPWGWGAGKTELEFFDASSPQNLVSTESLSIDGSLVASRRVGDTLYLVTRYTPVVEGFTPYPFDPAATAENDSILADTTLPQLLPKVVDSRDQVRDLIETQDCYLPVSAVDETLNPSIITITSVPLSDPSGLSSTCFLGASETLYMTTDSLYLATTQSDYDFIALDALFYSPEHSTAIHKFALDNGAVSYRGSGAVEGHLGWTEDKKSFRMGENGDYLNVVTSIGESWTGDSSTMLTVLTESAGGSELVEVDRIEGIGKPGEQLYAARFVGERAYLVTFRITDPLYVIDLSDQTNPLIAGELEIDGYSDYLHPVSEDLLLGIGKDAVPAGGSDEFFPDRGAWYQGVKLALFDVSEPSSPREVDSVVLGRRGTESDVLWDHHAFTYLPGGPGGAARVAIPVRLHDSVPQWEGFDGDDPRSWYDHTHTGLYSFEVSALGISQVGRIIAEEGGDSGILRPVPLDVVISADEGNDTPDDPDAVPADILPQRLIFPFPAVRSYSDRSVLLDDAVFYLHDGEILSSFWGENR